MTVFIRFSDSISMKSSQLGKAKQYIVWKKKNNILFGGPNLHIVTHTALCGGNDEPQFQDSV